MELDEIGWIKMDFDSVIDKQPLGFLRNDAGRSVIAMDNDIEPTT